MSATCFPHPRGAQSASTESGGSAARAGAVQLRLIQGGLSESAEQAGGWGLPRPILFAGGQGNLYVYVGNDPVGFVDPIGGEAVSATVVGVSAAIGGAVGLGSYLFFAQDPSVGGGVAAFVGGLAGGAAAPLIAAQLVGTAVAGNAAQAGILGAGLAGGLDALTTSALDPAQEFFSVQTLKNLSWGLGLGGLGGKVLARLRLKTLNSEWSLYSSRALDRSAGAYLGIAGNGITTACQADR